jgi:hypothetical protein
MIPVLTRGFFTLVSPMIAAYGATYAISIAVKDMLDAKKIAKFTGELIGNMGSGIGKGISSGIDGFFENLKFAEAAGKLGNEAKGAVEGVGLPINEAVGNVFGDFGSQLSWAFITNFAPTILGSIATVVGVPLAIRYVYHKAIYNMGKPKLAIKERQITMFTPLKESVQKQWNQFCSLFTGEQPSSEATPIFSEELQRRIDDLTTAIQNIRNNDGFFQNIILYGPGGTGKTMICEKMAKDAGMNYVMMSGGDLAQYIKRGEHVTELNKLFDRIESSSTPTFLFIDEAESFTQDRNKMQKAELIELLNAFLNRTGTPNKKVIIAMATNRIDDIDEAVLTRMDYKIEIAPPALAERVKILDLYASQFFSESEVEKFFSEEQLKKMAAKIDKFPGRTIFKLLNDISCKKAATAENELTQGLIDQSVNDFVKQEKDLEKRKIAIKVGRTAPAA